MDERDMDLRRAALQQIRILSERYDDLVPLPALRRGFRHDGAVVSYSTFNSGIFRPRQCVGPAALSIVTAPPKGGRDAPYDDGYDASADRFVYHYRTAATDSPRARLDAARDNATLSAAMRLGVPLIHFQGFAPGQYSPLAPVFIVRDDPDRRVVEYQAALPLADTTDSGIVSNADVRRYATREAVVRLHQHYFRVSVLRAYAGRCAVCALREAVLLQAAHILEDRDPRGDATVVNGISLCAIHHVAYDRNLMGIAPDGGVHIAHRLLREVDGPMLRSAFKAFTVQRCSSHADGAIARIRSAWK